MANKYIEYPKLRAIPNTDLAYIVCPSGVKYQNGYDNYIDYLTSKLGWDVEMIEEDMSIKDSNHELEQIDLIDIDDPALYVPTHEFDTTEGEQVELIESESAPLTKTATEQVITKKQKEKVLNKRILRDYCVKIFKRNGKSLEELSKDIKNNSAILVANTFFSAVNQKFEVDDNGNLLLRSFGSALDDVMTPGGDILINAEGRVLKNSQGQYFIHAHDGFGNYPVDVFVAEQNYKENTTEIVRIDHNFLDSNGKFFSQEHFEPTEDACIYDVDHIFSESGDRLFIDKSKTINPTAYVYSDKNDCMLFPSATALLIENRARKQLGEPALIEDESEYFNKHLARIDQIPLVQTRLTELFQLGKISMQSYKQKMRELDEELTFVQIFEREYRSPEDKERTIE